MSHDAPLNAPVQKVVRLANEQHRGSWSIVRRLSGGSQQGAYELRDEGGARAVLKWHARHLPAPQLAETAHALEAARDRGWPTSRWLAFGSLPGQGAYIIEEFIDGTVPAAVDDSLLDQLLAANRGQSDLRPRTAHDWSAYIWRTVFEDPTGDFARLRSHADTAAVAARLAHVTAPARTVQLPTADLVHGDFTLRNVLVRDGRPYLVDAGHAGKGTRAYDLAVFLVDERTHLSEAARGRLAEECRSLVGTTGMLLCAAARVIVLIEWGLRHWPSDVLAAAAGCEALITELGA